MVRSYQTLLAVHATALTLPLLFSAPALAQESTVKGVGAVPGATPAVTGEMTVRETSPLTREIELAYTNAATGQQVTDYDLELTQELHILAIDEQLHDLVHQHVKEVGTDGKFKAELEFPHPGTYHIYTDAVPTDLGQQVLRFDVPVGTAAAGQAASEAATATDVTKGPVSSSDGAYTVRLDATQLRAGKEGVMALSVEKGGQPATDIAPYLGVAAHVVLIRAEDLGYVHAHAVAADETMAGGEMDHGVHGTPAEEPAMDHAAAPEANDMAGMDMSDHAAGHDDAQGAEAADDHGMADTIIGTAGTVPAQLSVYVTPPAPGAYGLWIEFAGGGEVVTVPFKIDIPAN